jgi:DNA-binding NarL/FixJ family response regulator
MTMINREADLICCGEADTVAGTPSVVAEQKPDLVLLDLRLKDGESFELIRTLKSQFPNLPVLVLSQCDEAINAERALRAGAKGYVMKQEATSELLGAVRVVLKGHVYLSQEMATRLIKKLVFSPEPQSAVRQPQH